ncbi:MAG: cellulase family glycosylhydrolase [Candidatus Microgenomates bacterium]|jgi:hypothetical protein
MKKFLSVTLFIFIFFTINSCVFAENNPLSVNNNKVGIHITDERDLTNAVNLVNSNGGDWGYVTFVITEADRDHDRWQQIFDQMRKLHLIPIVRIATRASGDTWDAPQEAEINNWIAFLNSLNWVTENRYIVIYNEPNHATEWGGKIDPADYATYLNEFAAKLHAASPDFFVLPAGLDASAKNTSTTMDEGQFIKKMLAAEPNLFDNLNGWTSHSYPNPGFAGKATDTGRGSIDTFDWELTYLKSLGIEKDLPVFITETGWSNQSVDPNEISSMYSYAFSNVWNDPRVVAVTPFILNYPESPFSQFSWEKRDGTFYPYYQGLQEIPKVAGAPVQIESGQILGAFAQPVVYPGSNYFGAILAKNTGQSIWNSNEVSITSDSGNTNFENLVFTEIDPMRVGLIVFKSPAPDETGIFIKSIYLKDKLGKRITNSFPIESVIVDKMQLNTFFEKIGSYLQTSLNLKF